jgi:GNAT superfamily N-acetyltransferase
MDEMAGQDRLGWYQRACTVDECKWAIALDRGVLVTLDVSDQWRYAPKGEIRPLAVGDQLLGTHAVSLVGYCDLAKRFRFVNSWGRRWGDGGLGSIGYDLFEAGWWEGWRMGPPVVAIADPRVGTKTAERGWTRRGVGNEKLHCREFIDRGGLPVAWSFCVERGGVLHVEELYVKPSFRGMGYGKRLVRRVAELAGKRSCNVNLWISYADLDSENLAVVDRLAHRLGLGLIPSGLRWSPVVAVGGFNTDPSVFRLPDYDPPAVASPDWKSVTDLFSGAGFGAAISTLVYRIIQGRIDSKNGRRIRVKMDNFELETTQLSKDEFLQLLTTLRDAETSRQVKSKLLDAGFTDKTLTS